MAPCCSSRLVLTVGLVYSHLIYLTLLSFFCPLPCSRNTLIKPIWFRPTKTPLEEHFRQQGMIFVCSSLSCQNSILPSFYLPPTESLGAPQGHVSGRLRRLASALIKSNRSRDSWPQMIFRDSLLIKETSAITSFTSSVSRSDDVLLLENSKRS